MGKISRRSDSSARRSRVPNWTVTEKHYLVDLIRERKDIVMKNNNGPNHSFEKDRAWKEIMLQLSLKYGDKFSASTLKKLKTQWQNMKRSAREEVASKRGALDKVSRLSLDVCNVLDIVKDGVLVANESVSFREDIKLRTDVQIKTEAIDDDYLQPGPSGVQMISLNTRVSENQDLSQSEPPSMEQSSSYHQVSDEEVDDIISIHPGSKKDVASMTELVYQETNYPFHKEMQEFIRYATAHKMMRTETLKEERQVMRAMREAAELTKITAEQKLKHVLWQKKRDMMMYSGEPGSGAGKGGGGGGSIREAGGTFGKMEAAREDEFFYKKQKEQLSNLKNHLDKEISFHQEQIKRHEDAIRRHKEQKTNMDKE